VCGEPARATRLAGLRGAHDFANRVRLACAEEAKLHTKPVRFEPAHVAWDSAGTVTRQIECEVDLGPDGQGLLADQEDAALADVTTLHFDDLATRRLDADCHDVLGPVVLTLLSHGCSWLLIRDFHRLKVLGRQFGYGELDLISVKTSYAFGADGNRPRASRLAWDFHQQFGVPSFKIERCHLAPFRQGRSN
jgi:hypothetical protein